MRTRTVPARLKLLQVPAYLLNGLLVALGAGCVRLAVGALAGPLAGQLALSGALCASLADKPNTLARTWRPVFVAATLSFVAALIDAALKTHPIGLGVGIAVIGFGATLLLAWGQRAGPVSFAPVLALIFSMAVPLGSTPPWNVALWNGVGGLVYLGWAILTCRLMQRRYRTLALADVLQAAGDAVNARAQLLQSRTADFTDSVTTQAWVRSESALADALQAARDFVYVAPAGAEYERNCALLLRIFDLRDLLLASRLDLDLVGTDDAGRWILRRIAQALRQVGLAMESAAVALRTGTAPVEPAGGELDPQSLFDSAPLAAADPRVRLLPAMVHRLRNLAGDVRRIHALLRGASETPALTRVQLQRFVDSDRWSLGELTAQLSWQSPVLRHALRFCAALAAAYYISFALPWASHPHWLILSVAVVLRGNLEQTLSRRNMRIFGTLLGCAAVVVLMRLQSSFVPTLVFLLAVGVAHAFALRRYWVAATAATIMALLQAHLVNPGGRLPIGERVADTLLGALLAWGFSYVLPSWERRRLPQTIGRTLQELKAYARYALQLDTGSDAVEQRLARRRAYESLSDLAALMQRSSAEPKAVRVPSAQLAVLLDHGQRLMAHLSMVRMTLTRRRAELPDPSTRPLLGEALQEVQAQLDLQRPSGTLPPPPGIDELALLPSETPTQVITPWLVRRLQLLVHEAGLIHTAARLASTPPETRT
ncbi:MAG TPA: FUSC family membrane protein [Steroidobacteraceae bacterium]|nr:FUSC family membrane protein [Steroidobacteraceae bacterium]